MYIHSETTIVLTGRSYKRLLTLMRQTLATSSALRFHVHSTLPDGAIDITDGHGEPVQFSLDIARVGSPRRAPYRYRTRRHNRKVATLELFWLGVRLRVITKTITSPRRTST